MTPIGTAVSPPAATIFLVPARCDRLALGRRLAAPLLGERPQDHALALRGLHPDLMELVPPHGKEKVGIDQVREVLRMAQFSAVQAERKVCLVPAAEDLTPEASNALLKVLEEPTRGVAFALLASHTGDLLPTIVSRSRVERVQLTSQSQIVDRLVRAGYAPADAAWLAGVADRVREVDDLIAAPVDVGAARSAARERLQAASAADLVAACLDAGPIERREALLLVVSRAASRDPHLFTTGVSALATQERSTLFVFLGDLQRACAEALRDCIAADALDLSSRTLAQACAAVEATNRALLAYAPTEAALLSLFFALGGQPHDR